MNIHRSARSGFPARIISSGAGSGMGAFIPTVNFDSSAEARRICPVRAVHETISTEGRTAVADRDFDFGDIALIHHSYPTISDYVEHMNRYSSLGAEMAVAEGRTGFSVINIAVRPLADFHLQLLFPPGLSRRTGRTAAAPLPRGLRVLEICQALGAETKILACPVPSGTGFSGRARTGRTPSA